MVVIDEWRSTTRVRRARSSASPLRSPLTRKLLGLLGLIAAVAAASGCSASAQQSALPAPGEFPAGCLTHPKNTDPEVTPPRLTHHVAPKMARTDPSPVYVCLDATVGTDGTLADLRVLKWGSDGHRGVRGGPAVAILAGDTTWSTDRVPAQYRDDDDLAMNTGPPNARVRRTRRPSGRENSRDCG